MPAQSLYALRSTLHALRSTLYAPRSTPLVVLLLLAAYLLLPGQPLGLVSSLPWRPLALGCAITLLVLAYLGWPLNRGIVPGWVVAAGGAVLVVRLCLALAPLALGVGPYGLVARYYANASFHNVPESSTVWRSEEFTRVDQALDFGGDEFPLYFYNDAERFNTLSANRLNRRDVEFSVRWDGYLNVPEDRPVTLWLTASGPADLALDGKPLLKVDAQGRETASTTVQLADGPHKLAVRYARRPPRSGDLKVESDLGGSRAHLSDTQLSTRPQTPDQVRLDAMVGLLARTADAGYLLVLATMAAILTLRVVGRGGSETRPGLVSAPGGRGGSETGPGLASAQGGRGGSETRPGPRRTGPDEAGRVSGGEGRVSHPPLRQLPLGTGRSLPALPRLGMASLERPLLVLLLFAWFLWAALPRLDRVDKMVFLGGGQDWLTHETLARDILFNGPLMSLGKPLGQGALYYAQPFYPYALAALHFLTGEDLFGVYTIQVWLLGVTAVLLYYLAKRLFGRPTAVITLALVVGVLVPFQLEWVSRRLLSEAIYFPLVPAMCLALLVLAERPAVGRGVLAGALLGLAVVTRGPTLLYLPPAIVVLWLLWRRATHPLRARRSALLALALACGLIVGLVPLRNWIVAGRPALVASSGGVNLQKLHRPSDRVSLRVIETDPLHKLIDVDRPTRETIEYLRQDPAGYFGSYIPLALYTLGFASALEEAQVKLYPDLVLLNALYLLALLLSRRARGLESVLLHAFIGLHLLTMVVFAPYDYENRLTLPMYLLVTIFAAEALSCAGRLTWRRVRARRSHPFEAGAALANSSLDPETRTPREGRSPLPLGEG